MTNEQIAEKWANRALRGNAAAVWLHGNSVREAILAALNESQSQAAPAWDEAKAVDWPSDVGLWLGRNASGAFSYWMFQWEGTNGTLYSVSSTAKYAFRNWRGDWRFIGPIEIPLPSPPAPAAPSPWLPSVGEWFWVKRKDEVTWSAIPHRCQSCSRFCVQSDIVEIQISAHDFAPCSPPPEVQS